jgi:hypothetical protein
MSKVPRTKSLLDDDDKVKLLTEWNMKVSLQNNYTGRYKKFMQGPWGPDSKQEIALVKIVPRRLTGNFFWNTLYKTEEIHKSSPDSCFF